MRQAPYARPRARSGAAVAVALLVLAASASPAEARSFAERQNTAPRVVDARQRVGERVRALFEAKGVAYPAQELLLRHLKREGELELWAANERGGPMTLIKSFAVCAKSGELGPKRKAGDLQVPEGFYVVDRYNAWSSYHLSLGIDYPNDVDKIIGKQKGFDRLGYNIFLHGDCVTIGCVPIEDGPVEELYLAAVDTRIAHGGTLEVHMLPGRLDDAGLAALIDNAAPDAELLSFWMNLKEVYDLFEETRRKPRIRADQSGRYVIRPWKSPARASRRTR